MYDPDGHMPRWAKYLIGVVVSVGIIAVTAVAGGAALAAGAAIGAAVGAGLGVLSGVTFDENGKAIFDKDKAASGFMFGSITGAISGLVGTHFGNLYGTGSMLTRGIKAGVDGVLSLATYVGQNALDGSIKDVTLAGSLISLGSGLLNFVDPFDNSMDLWWVPAMGAEVAWVYDNIYNLFKKHKKN